MRQDRDPELTELLAKQEIRELVLKYCRATDRQDWELMATLYHDDATDDHGKMFCGSAKDYLAWLPGMRSKMEVTMHRVSNHYIVVDGERAEGEVYIVAYHLKTTREGEKTQIVTGGRYLDRYENRGSGWKFTARKAVLDWNEFQPALSRWPNEGGAREKDPAWAFFELLGK
jgi:hypothetical protein